MHPLVDDLSNLKDAELESKISDLTRKYFMTNNIAVREQISAMLDTYKDAVAARRQAEWQKMMDNRDKGLDKLININ